MRFSESYKNATPEQKAEHTNGCGAANAKFDFVPDTIYGLDISPACKAHDWEYYEGSIKESLRLLHDQGKAVGYGMLRYCKEGECDECVETYGKLHLNKKGLCKYLDEKRKADEDFHYNLKYIIKRYGGILKFLRFVRAYIYYWMVDKKGISAFWG